MKEVDELFPGGLAWPADWPDELPALRPVPPPSQLLVPILSANPTPPLLKPAGTPLSAGRSLVENARSPIAPLPGRIAGTTSATLLDGRSVPAAIFDVDPSAPAQIEPDAGDVTAAWPTVGRGMGALSHWMEILHECGIAADRRSSPDLLNQLALCANRPIDTVICNLIDHEPPLRLNATLAQHYAPLLAAGAHLVARLTGARRIIFAIDAVGASITRQSLVKPFSAADVDVVNLPARYPQADMTLLLHAVLDRRLRPGRLPIERGVLVLDGPAALAVGQAFLHQRPMTHVPIALRDRIRGQSIYAWAPIGMRVRDLLSALDVPDSGLTIRGGDFLRSIDISADAVIGPTELRLHALPRLAPGISGPCLRCRWCADHCPTGTQPYWLLQALLENNLNLAARGGLDSCIDCGICSYVCPSLLPLTPSIRKLKEVDQNVALAS